ncbi:MAG: copper resistance protein B [Gammaproteobacteria bacterium]|nr:copper resistance protein B [Gammaproteobacteria bacterium]
MPSKRVSLVTAAMLLIGLPPVWAQDPAAPTTATGEMEAMPGMDHSQMNHDAMPGMEQSKDADVAAGKTGDMGAMNHDAGTMEHGDMSMQGGAAPADARDPHAYAGGEDFGPIPRPRMGDEEKFGMLMIDRLEAVRSDGNTSTAYDLQAWYGRDYDRAVLKAEGDIDAGQFQDAHTDLLWGHALATYWDTQLGMRYDSGAGPDRSWLAFGIQGLAPYWFEVDATAYVGESGRTAVQLEAEYELLLTQKLILQPRVEANVYGKRDAERETGSGLSDMSAGLRLRYEIRRELAPYVGIEWAGKYGATADYARTAGEDTKEARVVAGLRVWY